jgi:ABC-type nitrate/sulfonate/bicarbonate transport system substrate-binding protein
MKLCGILSFRAPALFLMLSLAMTGCPTGGKAVTPPGGGAKGPAPVFSLAWSEYPSWSVFGVAHELKLINGKKGEMGEFEKKHNVDIVLKLLDYDACIAAYGTKAVDSVCITNMDILNASLTLPSVAILPTSTSKGADALIVSSDIKSVKDLKGKKVFGLAKSVSEYTFVRNLELLGEKESDYTFTNKDPGAAAIGMQQKDPNTQAIVVWNPFVLSTLEKRKDARVLFDSSKIPGEIIDMVVMSDAALKKPGGDRFAKAICETFYAISKRMDGAKTRDDTLIALGEKFSNLKLEAMKKVVTQTEFYKNSGQGTSLFKGSKLPAIMKRVVGFCESHDMIEKGKTVKIGYGSAAKDANLRFDDSYLKAAK